MATNVLNSGTLNNIMPLITQKHARAQGIDTCNTGHMQSSAHLNWQSVSPKPEARQMAHAPATQGQVKVGLWNRPDARKPLVVCAWLIDSYLAEDEFNCLHFITVKG